MGASVLASAFTKLKELVKSRLLGHATELEVDDAEKQRDSFRVTIQFHCLDLFLFQVRFSVASTSRIIKQH